MPERLSITRDIAASPDAVYAAISDVTRMGEWSEECVACQWHDGFDGPVVGATFDGHNRRDEKAWTTQGKVVEAEPGRAFTFECSMFGVHFSTWGYVLEPTPDGCRVTEWTDDLRTPEAIEFAHRKSGVSDRPERNRQTMSGTLERLAAALENS
ncbi:MAG: SRPBCC family protein [Acidimicrobiia bacterium]